MTQAPPGKNRPTLIHLVLALNVGGLEILLLRLVRHQVRSWDVHVICIEEPGSLASQFEAAGVRVHVLSGRRLSLVRRSLRLVRLLRRLRPRVVHTHNLSPHMHALLCYGIIPRTRLVHTRHGQHAREHRYAQVINWMSRRWTHALIAVSADASRYAIDAERFPAEHAHVIPNGVEMQDYRESTGPITSAVAVGRLVPVKAFEVLLAAMSEVVTRHPFTLTLIGDGPERRNLEELSETLGLRAHVHFLGHRSDVAQLLPTFGMYVLSSRSEGVPLTLLEAMASGLPIVATSVGGIPEIVRHEQEAFLVPPDNAAALAGAITRLISDPQSALRIGRAARQRAQQHYTIAGMAERYHELYTSPD